MSATVNTRTIDWQAIAGTVYGGTLDVTAGTLTVTHKGTTVGQLDWTYNAPSGTRIYDYFSSTTIQNEIALQADSTSAADILSSAYLCVSSSSIAKTGYDNTIAQGGYTLFIADSDYHSKNDFVQAMGDVQIIYPLATPITYTLTPEEVGTILLQVGRNNVWADTGPVTFKFFN